MKLPLVSIVIPAFKSKFIRQAIESATSQDYPNLEIIVCDDCHTDEINEVIQGLSTSIPVLYEKNKINLGERYNLAKAVRLSSGKYIKFLYDDDVLETNCISALVEVAESDAGISLVSSRRRLIDEAGRFLPDIPATSYPFDSSVRIDGSSCITNLARRPINYIGEPSSVLCRREDILQIGPDPMSLDGTPIDWIGDLAMYVNLLHRGDLALLAEPLSRFRISTLQFSNDARLDKDIANQDYAEFTEAINRLQWSDRQSDGRLLLVAPLDLGAPAYRRINLEKSIRDAYLLRPADINAWLAARTLTPIQRELVERRANEDRELSEILFFLLVDDTTEKEAIDTTLSSLAEFEYQQYLTIEKISASSARIEKPNFLEKVGEVLSRHASAWVGFVRPGEIFLPSGLLMAISSLKGADSCWAVSMDEVYRLANGETGGAFRPAFNLDYLLSFPSGNSRHWLFNSAKLRESIVECVTSSEWFELEVLLRMAELGGLDVFGHISEPLTISDAPVLEDTGEVHEILSSHLARRGYCDARVLCDRPGRYKIVYPHGFEPMVSIIIPTRNQLPMLQRCVETLLEETEYSRYEILIVDNRSDDPDALAWLEGVSKLDESKIRVVRYPEEFNFSAINNMAVSQARGEYLVLLNNDTAIISKTWLKEMINHALRPEVGIVGSKLLFPDGSIQHAGVILGLGGPAEHPFIGEASDAPGYMHRLQVTQNYTALTAACLMIRKSVYVSVGGMDETAFKVSYNDVDLCLKVRQAGYLLVWSPHSVVLHEGSVSQTHVDQSKQREKRARFVAEQDAMYSKWLPVLARDPAYNRNLSLVKPGGFKLADTSISWRPLDSWRPLPVLLAHPADLYGCGHYRVIQPFDALRDKGIVDGALSVGLMHVADLERYDPDVVLLQRQIGSDRLEALRRMKAFSRAFKVYELDDYLPGLPLKSAHRQHMPKDVLRSIKRGLSYVDRFVVSTSALADVFAADHPSIHVVENRLDPVWWGSLPEATRRQSGKPRIGWAGGASHTGDLELVYDVVKDLSEEVDWVFFGMCPDKLRPHVHEFHAGVPIAQYPSKLASLDLDLAIAPVEQNLFNECKSNLRLLEYGICGFPVVCSDVRCYQGQLPVTRVKNRYRDWVDAIRQHLADPEASEQAGRRLQAAVRRDWMLDEDAIALWKKAWLQH
ncbi:Glycosyltransferase, GT2 family [Halopseudomonas xinjiangensis]|uniref:Glycosyltransferase, GT2 family n=1 Tax=Halopseudomonas xinjiangensis TaxID=487184 RepID=A0A1H1MN87_9GAMM|nr:glycosyltransferase [Halopseudomonas xinjiangensis]SDR88208.1 Glycosyltransferase, GT2 family [Halopseudomonas xinjiangensis]